MIPIRLAVEGLYSYQEKVEIDFAQLTSGRLFGIFGKVGSGKSALLEAITFALYGKTERINSKMNYNMMNLRSDRLFIDFEFEIGTEEDRDRYRFEVKSRRNSKQFEDVKKYERTGFHWDGEAWVPLASNNAQHILHLSYDHFIKTIIIPQGKFQEFLHMTAAPRTRMLKELFELQKYDLADAVKRLNGENEEQVNRLGGRLEEIPEVSAEDLQEATEKLAAQTEVLLQIQAGLKALAQEDQELKQIQEIKQELEQVRDMLGKLVPEEADFKDRKVKLERFIMVKNVFDESLRRQASYQERATELGKIIPLLQESLLNFEAQQVQLDRDFQQAKEAFDGRDILKEKAQEMLTLAEMLGLQASLKTLAARVGKGKLVLDQEKLAQQVIQDEIKAVQSQLEALKTEMPDGNLLLELQSWFNKSSQLLQLKEEAMATLASAKSDHEATQTDFLKWLSQPLVQSVAVDAGRELDDLASHLENTLHAEQEALDALQSRQREVEVHARLNDYAAALAEGEPCPLCGATEHPHPATSEETAERLEQLNREAEAIRHRIQQLTRLQPELGSWQDRQGRNAKEAERLEKVLVERLVQLESHQATFLWPDFSPDQPDKVAELMALNRELREKEATLQADANRLRLALDQKNKDLERFGEGIQRLAQEEASYQGQFLSKQESLRQFDYADFEAEEAAELKAKGGHFQQEYESIGTIFERLQKRLESHKEALLEKRHQLDKVAHDQNTVTGELKVLAQALAEKVDLNGLEDVAEAQRILAWKIETVTEKKDIESFEKDLRDARREHENWSKKEAGRSYDPIRHASVGEGMLAKEVERSAAEQDKARLEVGFEQMRKDQAARARLQKEMEGILIRAENLKVMESLFRVSGFVNYVSTIYLRELCERANVRFQQLTRHQLSLMIDEGNDFQIRDNLNDGKVRSVRTLSGGQTFQASLCLALALADNINQRMGNTQNFFFLDEGFGSLDRESLNLVFETLKQLREENRIVGVISHVEDLQEEIPQYLHIHKDEEKGSQVRESWA